MKIVAVVAVTVLLAGCTAAPSSAPRPTTSPAPSATPVAVGPVEPTGEPLTVTAGLAVPWSILRLESGSTLISERNNGVIKELEADGSVREVATIPGVVNVGESGLLGLEFVSIRGVDYLYVYYSTAADNRIVRYELLGDPGSYRLGASRGILSGLVMEAHHDGGRIKLGPDGMLYATVGDAGNLELSQDLASYNGKILRMNLDGSVPSDNPWPGSLVYSMGHRNPQGLAWDDEGRLWAAEFGQDTWDELNLITPGGNYGWPVVEGMGSDPAYISPVIEWPTDVASPSGLAWQDGTLFLAGLGGERLLAIYPDAAGTTATSTEWFAGVYGRIRDVVPGPGGTLWMLTCNTDGRGTVREGDDRILQVDVAPLG